MDPNFSEVEFTRSKIYERLDYVQEPSGYSSKIPWIVQQQIAATNGIHYLNTIGKLKGYPEYELPVPQVTPPKLMLDIGSGWGRWLVAGAKKGYIPVGMDLRLEFCQTNLQVMKDCNVTGYSVVADLENIPFVENTFDLVWSFSVIQHTHKRRLTNCLEHINRILSNDGFCFLEFPNKNGIRNRFGPVPNSELHKDEFNSWCVRYYTPQEYREIFSQYLKNFSYRNHSAIGIGVLKEDINYLTGKEKLLTAISLAVSGVFNAISPLKQFSDSLYIRAEKNTNLAKTTVTGTFLELHHSKPFDNLNIVPLLKCPKYGGALQLSADRRRLISIEAGIAYPIENNIPILISSEAISNS